MNIFSCGALTAWAASVVFLLRYGCDSDGNDAKPSASAAAEILL
jgi:hypothetical protein